MFSTTTNWPHAYRDALYMLFLTMDPAHFHAALLSLHYTRVNARYAMACEILRYTHEREGIKYPKVNLSMLCESGRKVLKCILAEYEAQIQQWNGMGYYMSVLGDYEAMSAEEQELASGILYNIFKVTVDELQKGRTGAMGKDDSCTGGKPPQMGQHCQNDIHVDRNRQRKRRKRRKRKKQRKRRKRRIRKRQR